MIDFKESEEVSNLFKILGDQTRVRILFLLENKELCVTDICINLEMTKSAISHQLRVLKDSKLLRSKRDGKEIYYTLNDDHVKQIFDCALEHVRE